MIKDVVLWESNPGLSSSEAGVLTATLCLQEMLQNGHVVTHDTFHFLLMACLKDKKTGFRLALQVNICGRKQLKMMKMMILKQV